MLLKAYYWMIKSQKSNAIKILKKLQKVCKKMENKMIYAWALHCEKVSIKILSNDIFFLHLFLIMKR